MTEVVTNPIVSDNPIPRKNVNARERRSLADFISPNDYDESDFTDISNKYHVNEVEVLDEIREYEGIGPAYGRTVFVNSRSGLVKK